jgi:hypothetical protein
MISLLYIVLYQSKLLMYIFRKVAEDLHISGSDEKLVIRVDGGEKIKMNEDNSRCPKPVKD